MFPFERSQVATLLQRLAGPPRWVHALFGPRQSGKTTIVDQALARAGQELGVRTVYAATDEPESLAGTRRDAGSLLGPAALPPLRPEWIIRHWNHARILAERASGFPILVLDEIQKIRGWSEVVKGLWDADRGRRHRPQVVILGSAPVLMQSGLKESLAGRFRPLPVHHWSLREMSEAFDFSLREYLFHGGYPGVAGLVRDGEDDAWREAVLEGCLRPAVTRDILGLVRVDKPALMNRLFEMSAHYSGRIVSFTKLLGHLQGAGNTTTLARYLDLLEGAGLVAGLSGYAGRPLRRRSTPKLIVLNTALMTAVSGYRFAEAQSDPSFWGRVVETAVGTHLFATRTPASTLHYWRKGHHEVDFVLARGPHLLAIEVKSGPYRGRHAGLAAFQRHFPKTRTLMVGEGGVPLHEFLAEPAERWLTNRA